jgi:cytochrome b
MEDGMIKSYIWPLPNRVAHLLLILFFTLSYILGDFDRLLSYHVAFGLAFGVVIVFRIAWGLIGPKHSKFSDFNFSILDLKEYMFNVFTKTKKHIGHNPASSYAIIAMIVLALLSIFSGLLAYGIEENHGIFSFLHSSYFREMEIFKEAHELFANLLLGVILLHVSGTLIDKFIKRGDAIDSMIHGYKQTKQEESIKINILQKTFGLIWIVCSLFALYYLIFDKSNIFIANANVKQNYALLHSDFSKECGSCHIAFPPYLLPANSWDLMMSDLTNHFGDDASLDEPTTHSILSFLKKNSAENSTHQASLKILKSLKDKNSTIAITKTPYWIKKHKELEQDIFASNEVKSKANCQACHQEIQNGLLENDLIKVPKIKKG